MHALHSSGRSGGIIILWRLDDLRVHVIDGSSQQLVMIITDGSGTSWLLAAIYASTNPLDRRSLWGQASAVIDLGLPTLLLGDFNCILEPEDKRGGRPFSRDPAIRDFSHFIHSNGLLDLGFQGPRFTWCNNRSGNARVHERIDRCLATASWLQMFPDAVVKHLLRMASDHCPILLSTSPAHSGHAPFRFEKFWLTWPRSWDIVRETWAMPIRGDARYRITRRLELLQRRLRRWNRIEVGDISVALDEVEDRIRSLQDREFAAGGLADQDLASLRREVARHHALLRDQETLWRQKSRIQWLQAGDRNTAFFHQATLIRRRGNRIRCLRSPDGSWIVDPQCIRREVLSFFRARWSDDGVEVPDLAPPPLSRFSEEDRTRLSEPVSPEEISATLASMSADRAPGPDGYPPLFFQRYWHIIHREVIAAIQEFFLWGTMPDSWKRTFITLIPKKPDASTPSHFRPISLCNTLYKLVARILAARISPALSYLISPEQGAFLAGRSISDNILLAQEFMTDLHRAPRSRSLMAVKLDMERAYDRMRWPFLRRTLLSFGVPDRCISWIMACVSGPSFSILLNGTPTEFFPSSVGLRQGCPLSPFLFILGADSLSRALRHASQTDAIAPYRPASGAPPLSHLLYADDCILLTRASISSAFAIRNILHSYCAASGQRVNLLKSEVRFSPRTPPPLSRRLSQILTIRLATQPLSYLGVPISGRRLSMADCREMISTIRRRVDGWQGRILSLMGRAVLIRSVLASIPIYMLSNVSIPTSVLRDLDRIFRSFLWRPSQGRSPVHLLDWDTICQPLRTGGLGLPSIAQRRDSLLTAQAARLLLQPHSLAAGILQSRYHFQDHPDIGPYPVRRPSAMWADLRTRLDVVASHISWSVGNGSSIRLLADAWLADIPLLRWPTFVSSSATLDMFVADLISPASSWCCDRVLALCGPVLGARVMAVALPSHPCPDRRCWRSTVAVRPPLRDLSSILHPPPRRSRDLAWIWSLRLHPRLALFLWKLAWRRLPTAALLHARGFHIPSSCPACSAPEETLDHLLFHCPRAMAVWGLAGFHFTGQVHEDLTGIFLHRIRSRASDPDSALLPYIAYSIWLARNALLFSERRISARFSLESARALASEARLLALSDPALWGSPSALRERRRLFFSWEPPPPGSVKVNFDASVSPAGSGAAFVIRDHSGAFLVAGGCCPPPSSVPLAELRAAWEGIRYAVCTLGARRICLEGDSLTVITWIRRAMSAPSSFPLLVDIVALFRGLSSLTVNHVYREANSAADWVASFVAFHDISRTWSDLGLLPVPFRDILFSDRSARLYSRLVT